MRRCPDTPLRWSLFQCRKFPRRHPERSAAACQSFAQVRSRTQLERWLEIPPSTAPFRCRRLSRQRSLFPRCQRRQSQFLLLDLIFPCSLVLSSSILPFLILRNSFFRQQTVFVFHNEGTITKRVTVHSRKSRKVFRCELRGN